MWQMYLRASVSAGSSIPAIGSSDQLLLIGLSFDSITPSTLWDYKIFMWSEVDPTILFQSSIPFEYPPTDPGNLDDCSQAGVKFTATENPLEQVTYTVSVTLNPNRHCDRGNSIAVLEFSMLFPPLVIQWEKQTYSYTLQDVATSVFAVWSTSLTIIAFLFPWQESTIGIKQRKFVFAHGSRPPQQGSRDKEALDTSIPLAQWDGGS